MECGVAKTSASPCTSYPCTVCTFPLYLSTFPSFSTQGATRTLVPLYPCTLVPLYPCILPSFPTRSRPRKLVLSGTLYLVQYKCSLKPPVSTNQINLPGKGGEARSSLHSRSSHPFDKHKDVKLEIKRKSQIAICPRRAYGGRWTADGRRQIADCRLQAAASDGATSNYVGQKSDGNVRNLSGVFSLR